MSISSQSYAGFAWHYESDGTISYGCAVKDTTTTADNHHCAAAGVSDVVIGVATADAVDDGAVGILKAGTGKVRVNANTTNIAAGDKLKVGTSTGIYVKANGGEVYSAIAMEPASADDALIYAVIIPHQYAAAAGKTVSTASGATNAVTAAEISGRTFTVSMSFAGASALSIPSALTVDAGTVLIINKAGSAGAVTVSATAGNVAGGATYTAIDALNDTAILIPVGANWLVAGSAIA